MEISIKSFLHVADWHQDSVANVTASRVGLLTMFQRRAPAVLSLALVLLMVAFAHPALALTPERNSAPKVHNQSGGHPGHTWWRAGNATPNVYGQTIGNWGHAWWQWVSNFAAADNPINQNGNVDCSAGQHGKVWYLAGTFGGSAERTCSIKKGKAIFFPIINGLFWTPINPAVPEDCIDEATCRNVSSIVDPLLSWTCTVREEETPTPATPCVWFAQIVRAQSDPRPFNIPDGSSFTAYEYLPGVRKLSIADGYWVMLDPLPRGKHEIHFTAMSSTGFSLDVIYHLTVGDSED